MYLRSNECAVAESFLNAFKNFDVELLDKARSPTSIMYADPDFQEFAKSLTFMGENHLDFEPSAVNPPPAATVTSSELQDSLNAIKIESDDDNVLEVEKAHDEPNETIVEPEIQDDDINLC